MESVSDDDSEQSRSAAPNDELRTGWSTGPETSTVSEKGPAGLVRPAKQCHLWSVIDMMINPDEREKERWSGGPCAHSLSALAVLGGPPVQ